MTRRVKGIGAAAVFAMICAIVVIAIAVPVWIDGQTTVGRVFLERAPAEAESARVQSRPALRGVTPP